jgi:alpha-galactosidase
VRVRLQGRTLSLIAERGEDGAAHLVWFGRASNAQMARAASFQRLPASPDIPTGPGLMPEHGKGFHGIAQIEGFCLETGRRIRLSDPEIREESDGILLNAEDAALGIRVESLIRFDGDALVTSSRIANSGASRICVQRLASCLLPAPDWANVVLSQAGAWGREGHSIRTPWTSGRVEQVGRSGRPGFDGGPTLTLCETATSEHAGRALTAHLAWSGAFRLAAERATDGQGQILAEANWAPGECILSSLEDMETPQALLALSDQGFNGVSQIFHETLRCRSRKVARPVHFNTWEARYFAVDEASCMALARQAAALGAERFILDDGWFKGRRNDQTSLGDWVVDGRQFPDGLQPLVDVVHQEGMEFGLWVEPEMVSPDSDLYRAHPDWVLGYPDEDLATGRHQLVLDLALPEVQTFVFDAISSLLAAYPIGYLKWDCNRDLYPATRRGIARAAAQTDGLYALMQRITAAHPVVIESCASGGGRMDAGIAAYTQRFWTSDATDAIDRIRIQRAASLLFPAEMCGAHVGPSPNPMTGRHVPMSFRVLAALFGHFGIEADPETIPEADRVVLRRGIDIYKRHRDWMVEGRWIRISEADSDPDVQMSLSRDGGQALLRLLRINTPMRPLQPRIRLAGLEAGAMYRLNEIALEGEAELWPVGEFSGAGLLTEGLLLDPGRALSGRLIHLERIT